MKTTSLGPDDLAKPETDEDDPVSRSSSKDIETEPDNESEDLLFKCNCDAVYSSVEDFHSRKTKFCKTKSQFCLKCPVAGCPYKVTIRGRNLTPLEVLCDHMRAKHTRETVHSCSYCNKGFASLSALRYHAKQHEDKDKFHCPDCGRFFPFDSYKIHSDKHKIMKFECEICGKLFTAAIHLQTHKETHSNRHKYPCPKCDRRFHQKGNLTVHIKRKHPSSNLC